MNFEEIVKDVSKEIAKDEEFSKKFYITMYDGDDLHQFHHSLGQWIRNNYNLWEIPWEPELRDGVDYSPHHPDQVSMTIIEEVWKRGIAS